MDDQAYWRWLGVVVCLAATGWMATRGYGDAMWLESFVLFVLAGVLVLLWDRPEW